MTHFRSIHDARERLREIWRSGRTLGSVHSLGALHEGHGKLIQLSAAENDETIVTVYPNRLQLAPGQDYPHDPEADALFAEQRGATIVVSSNDAEMVRESFCTSFDRPEYDALDQLVDRPQFRGIITGCLRWISYCRPTRSYWGLKGIKDIGQALLVQRAVEDLLIDTEIRLVPCARLRNGIPISSRLLRFLDEDRSLAIAAAYGALQAGRRAVDDGEKDSATVVAVMRAAWEAGGYAGFRWVQGEVLDVRHFTREPKLSVPFLLHCAIAAGSFHHYDTLLIASDDDLKHGPRALWIDE